MKSILFLIIALPSISLYAAEPGRFSALQGIKAVRVTGNDQTSSALRAELARAGIVQDEESPFLLVPEVTAWKLEVYPGWGESTMFMGRIKLQSVVTVHGTETLCIATIWESQVYQGYLGPKNKDSVSEVFAEGIKKSLADQFVSDWVKASSIHAAKQRDNAIAVKNWCEQHPDGGTLVGEDSRTITLSARMWPNVSRKPIKFLA